MAMPNSILLVGAGKMGLAMLEGWLKLGVDGRSVAVLDPHPSPALGEIAARQGVAVNPAPGALAPPDALVLAIKPQSFAAAAPDVNAFVGPRTLVLSIMAGQTMDDMAARLPAAGAVARAMPNTPAAVGRGITGVFAGAGVLPDQRAMAEALLSAVGRVEWVEREDLIDAVTALSGSGPAYVFYLAECMAKAGVAAGLPADVAARLARATVEGAGELMFREAATAPGKLRENVTSPGGTTAAALAVLMADDGLAPLMARAVLAAEKRAKELAG
jgi:pyrroline-5-carboxylate reductase